MESTTAHICPRVKGRSIVVPSTAETLTPSYECPLLNSISNFPPFPSKLFTKTVRNSIPRISQTACTRFISMAAQFRSLFATSIHLSSKRNPGIALTHAIISIGFAISRFPRPPPLLPPPQWDAYLGRKHIAAKTQPDYARGAAAVALTAKRFSNSVDQRDKLGHVVYPSPCIQTGRPIVAPVCT